MLGLPATLPMQGYKVYKEARTNAGTLSALLAACKTLS